MGMERFKKKLTAGEFYSLESLGKEVKANVGRLPVTIRIMLESLMRNCDGKRISEKDVAKLAHYQAKKLEKFEVPFIVSRVLLQDFTGVPLVVDLAAMRDAAGKFPEKIEPIVPVDLVIDHSVQVDRSGTESAFKSNLELEFQRNKERYEFLKWGENAFKTLRVIPPGIGIVHQVNLEYLASVVTRKEHLLYFDTLVGTDSHTTMVNGLGVLGWGVGGIEAEAAMLGQPVYLEVPEVIGVHLKGKLPAGITATDLTLFITELLRKEHVVGKFVEFFGEGAASLSVVDRSTIANMAPEYGATVGFFAADERTLQYLKMTGRDPKDIDQVKEYLSEQGLFGIPKAGTIDYSKEVTLDLASISPSVAGPKRPQDRIDLPQLKKQFLATLTPADREKKVTVHTEKGLHTDRSHNTGGTNKSSDRALPMDEAEMTDNRPITKEELDTLYTHPPSHFDLKTGAVVIAAITSCTNTSNPNVMIGAGLLAKKAVEKGLTVPLYVKTSLAPGSRVVTDYLEKSGLNHYLDQLGFQIVGYGCTTCIGNSGPLDDNIEKAIKDYDLTVASVLSGNRNFEARIHGSVKANFLMSPPLVVAFALAGRVDIDMEKEPLGHDCDGNPVFLKDIWPSDSEIEKAVTSSLTPEMFKKRYAHIEGPEPWKGLPIKKGLTYQWDEESTYIRNPPYFKEKKANLPLTEMRALAILGDSVTTDHISPAGSIRASTPAGLYLKEKKIDEAHFNSYGSRRGNHEVMMRGTFANIRLRNTMVEQEGGYTLHKGKERTIFDAAMLYKQEKTPLILFAGKDYGMGSSRDWAAKGSALLGVRVVVAESYERIHRSNLVGMGLLPLQFPQGISAKSLRLKGTERFSILDLPDRPIPGQMLTLKIERDGHPAEEVSLLLRIDTPIEVDYYEYGGILPYTLHHLTASI